MLNSSRPSGWSSPSSAFGFTSAIFALAVCACSASRAEPDASAFDAARAWKHLEAQVALGPRPSASESNEKLRVYLEKELTSYGLAPVRETFSCAEAPNGPLAVANVYADIAPKEGNSKTLPIVVFCTHFDTKRYPFPFLGANDGGSGTAVLLELARDLAANPSSDVIWRVVFLDGEEAVREYWEDPDNRYGSRHHVEALKKRGEASRVKACILLDMIGDKDLRVFRDSYSDSRLKQIVQDAASSLDLAKHFDGTAEAVKDDHLSFMSADIPSLDLIDFDYGPDNDFWHTKKDVLENCSQESLSIIGRVVLAMCPKLERLALGKP